MTRSSDKDRAASHDRARRGARGPADVWIPLAIAAVLVVHCVVLSSRRQFWLDEHLSLVMIRDPSLSHMLAALRDTVNAFPPTYFLIGRAWVAMFGSSELSLRLLSSLPMAGGVWLAWRMSRITTGRAAASLGTLAVMFGCGELMRQNVEARCYGLYFLGFAASALALARSAEATGPLSTRLKLGVALSSALLVGVHYVGAVLSLALWLCGLAAWLATRSRKWGAYLACAAGGWLILIPCLPYFLAQRRLASDLSWIGDAHRAALLAGTRFDIMFLDFLVAACAIGVVAALGLRRAGDETRDEAPRARAEPEPSIELRATQAAFIGVSLAVPPAVWLLAQVGPKLFLARYLFPLALAWGWCAAEACQAMLASLAASRGRRAGAARLAAAVVWASLAAFAVVTFGGLAEQVADVWNAPAGAAEKLMRHYDARRPEARYLTSDLHSFMPLRHERRDWDGLLMLMPDEVWTWHSRALKAIALGLKRQYLEGSTIESREAEESDEPFVVLREQFELWRATGHFADWEIIDGQPDDEVIVIRREGAAQRAAGAAKPSTGSP